MLDFDYSIVIEATQEPDFFGFYSPDVEGFSGIGHSIEDCIYQAKWALKDHIKNLKELNLPIPQRIKNPKIIIQNQEDLVAV